MLNEFLLQGKVIKEPVYKDGTFKLRIASATEERDCNGALMSEEYTIRAYDQCANYLDALQQNGIIELGCKVIVKGQIKYEYDKIKFIADKVIVIAK